MKDNSTVIGRLGARNTMCILLAALMILALSVIALADTFGGDTCPNHLQHDETCGYVEAKDEQPCQHIHSDECYDEELVCTHVHTEECGENGESCTHVHTEDEIVKTLNCQHIHDETCGYAEAVEGKPCTHECAVCHPAGKLEENKAEFDKNYNADGNKDIKISFDKGADNFSQLEKRVYDSTGKALVDYEGKDQRMTLRKDNDYTVSDDGQTLTIKKEYMNTLPEQEHDIFVMLESGVEQKFTLTVENSVVESKEAIAETAPVESLETSSEESSDVVSEESSEPASEESSDAASEESSDVSSEESSAESSESAVSEDPLVNKPAVNGVSTYEIIISADTIAENADTVDILAPSANTGVLSLAVSLPQGAKGRYIEVILPAYGMDFGTPLPESDGKVTGVWETIADDGRPALRLYIADSVDETINFQVPYQYQALYSQKFIQWGNDGTLPRTGFGVKIIDGSQTILAEKDYGNWKPLNREGDSITGIGPYLDGGGHRDIPNNNSGYYGYYPYKFTFNETGDSDENQTPRATFEKLRIYVPNPDLVTLIGANVQAADISGYEHLLRLERGEIQTNGTDWWYDLTPPDYANDQWSLNGTNFAGHGEYIVTVQLEKAPGSSAVPGQEFSVKPMELITRHYGKDDLHTKTISWTPKMKDATVDDYFDVGFTTWGTKSRPVNVIAGGNTSNLMNDAGVFLRNTKTFGGTGSGNVEYLSSHDADPTTETYEFPYEVQPTSFEFYRTIPTIKLKEVIYTTSGGGSYTATVSESDDRYFKASFDAVPQGERVTNVKVIWNSISRYGGGVGTAIKASFTTTREDGTPITSRILAQVKYTASTPRSTKVLESGDDQIWYAISPAECPIPQFNVNSSSEYSREDVILLKETSFTGIAPFNISLDTDGGKRRGTVTDPVIRVWNEFSDLTREETVGYFYTGKMTVMPDLAGWTVKYKTNDKGYQEYTLPSNIPSEGTVIQIPLDDGDYFTSVLAFAKEGTFTVSGNDIIRDIEFRFFRYKRDGSLFTLPDSIYTADNMRMFADLIASDCPSSLHPNKGDVLAAPAGDVYWKFLNSFRNANKIIISNDTANSNIAASDIYQGSSAGLTVRLAVEHYWELGEREKLPKNNSVYTNKDVIPYGKNVEMYVEIKNPEILYTGADANLYPTFESSSQSADVEYIETANGKVWLKITTPETFENLPSLTSIQNSSLGFYVKTALYALPGAQIGVQPVIGDVYLNLHVDELQAEFDGTDESKDYAKYVVSGTVPDENGLLDDGDTTTPRLFRYADGGSNNVLQKIFSGVSLIPGNSKMYATETRVVDVYKHDLNSLRGLVSIGSAAEELTDYDIIVEIPKKGKVVTGKLPGDATEVSKSSEWGMMLKKAPVIIANSNSVAPTSLYRLVGSSSWITESQVSDWSKVDAIKINISKLDAMAVLSFELDMRTDDEPQNDVVSSYIGGSYTYVSASGQTATGNLSFGQYNLHMYSLQGTVWNDLNEDGAMDGSEPKMENITVNIRRISDDSIVATQKTTVNGTYSFDLDEGDNLYAEVELPEGHKLTKNTIELDFTKYDTDSDFDRVTNKRVLPNELTKGTYLNLGAGIVKLPVITVKDIILSKGESTNVVATLDWDYSDSLANLKYTDAADTTIATVDTIGTVNAVLVGKTTATVWVENLLGDKVEVTYNITVIPQKVGFTLSKTLTEPATGNETFVFEITRAAGDGLEEQTFYQTLTIAAGNSSASTKVEGVYAGSFTVTELDSNWRYQNQGAADQTQELSSPDDEYSFAFTNAKDNDKWVSGNAKLDNTMENVAP